MGSTELFLTRDVKDPQLIERCKAILDEWSGRIPFSPIKKLGSKTEFISAVEHATYKTRVTTQIEKRWLEDHEQPYREEKLPPDPLPQSRFDPWKFNFPPFADFSKHKRSQQVFDTRRVYDCSTCRATGEVSCDDCVGLGEVRCSNCNGYGHNECSDCSGSGHIRQTRSIPREVNCYSCSGSGRWILNSKETCPTCNGRGSVFENFEEEYYVPCSACASSGKIACHTCRGHGKVTCGNCGGSGKVECSRCEGQRRLLAYTTVEVAEEPTSNANQYVTPALPRFRKKDNPLSNLEGQIVFTQDETKRIGQFEFQNQPAAATLSNEVNSCRASHTGHVLRQRMEIEASGIIEYRYRHSTKEYSIYLNPLHGLVEDLEGPIQASIANVDTLAEEAFKEKRYEDAYRLVTRGLCMDEATESEKQLRDQALRALVMSYGKLALLGWLAAAVAWCLVDGFLSHFQINWWFVLGLLPLPFAIQLFAQDVAVRFRGPRERVQPAILIGVMFLLSGAGIGAGTSWTNWIGLTLLITATCSFGSIRSKERTLHTTLEAYVATFPSPQELETYVLKLDPKPEPLSRTILTLVLLVALQAVQPMLHMITGVNGWALDRTRVEFDLQINGKPAQASGDIGPIPEVLFNGQAIHSGDKVQPGKGVFEVTDMRFMLFRREARISYGSVANIGTIELTRAHGHVTITSDPPDAEFQLMNQSHSWSGNLPFQMDIPTGDYQLITRRKGWALNAHISVVRGGSTTNRIEFPYGSIEVTSDPTSMVVLTNGVEIGKTPLTLQHMKPGRYALSATDGENELMASVTVGPKEAAKQAFRFRYGSVQLSSTPSGATVIRKGREAGKTPLKLERITAGGTAVELRMEGYVTTNVALQVVEGKTANLTAKLISERYLQAMKQAGEAIDAGRFAEARKFIDDALESEPSDSRATKLRGEVAQAERKWEETRKEIERKGEQALRSAEQAYAKMDFARAGQLAKEALAYIPNNEQAKTLLQKSDLLQSVTVLDYQKVFDDCVILIIPNPDGTNPDGSIDLLPPSELRRDVFSQRYLGKQVLHRGKDFKVDKKSGIITFTLKYSRGPFTSVAKVLAYPRGDNPYALVDTVRMGDEVIIIGTISEMHVPRMLWRFSHTTLTLKDVTVVERRAK